MEPLKEAILINWHLQLIQSNEPLGSTLLQPSLENNSELLAKKLCNSLLISAAKFKKAFFVSFNLPSNDVEIIASVEREVFQFVNKTI
jgi:hypothetical protein